MPHADFTRKVSGLGVLATRVDGNDVEAVHRTVSDAVAHARDGGGPVVVEATTMRMLGHAIHDGAEYVPPDMLAEWQARDPVASFRARLVETGAATAERIDALDAAARERVAAAWVAAEAAPLPDPAGLNDGVYAG
jgi:pyruvate dehydrogenase E1 component alpha subunit